MSTIVTSVEEQVIYFPSIVTSVLIRLAAKHQWYMTKHEEAYNNSIYTPNLKDVSYYFYQRSGTLRVVFKCDRLGLDYEIGDYKILRRDELCDLKGIQLKFAEFVQFMTKEMRLESIITVCECPFHIQSEFTSAGQCNLIENEWWCERCIALSGMETDADSKLIALEPGYTKEQERAKMSNKLRFAVLSRDNFCCRACGRNPREDGVKLHVDHIVAIANNGKTEIDNLQTLCQNCNLAKTDKVMIQMELWPKAG